MDTNSASARLPLQLGPRRFDPAGPTPRVVGRTTYCIAEAGSCHDGRLEAAYALIDVAADAGADACKFQWTSSAQRLAQRRNAPEYEAAYRLLEFPRAWHELLAARCWQRGLDYLCTVYLPEDIGVIEGYVPAFKIASFESQDWAFIEAHLRRGTNKPLIVSTGMQDAIICRTFPKSIWFLHCVSAYPAPLEDMNLAVIRRYGLHGLSDHSGMVSMGRWAVLAGARILETHIKLESSDGQNPDAGPHALMPQEYRDYVTGVRFAEQVLGTGEKVIQPSERPMTAYRSQGDR